MSTIKTSRNKRRYAPQGTSSSHTINIGPENPTLLNEIGKSGKYLQDTYENAEAREFAIPLTKHPFAEAGSYLLWHTVSGRISAVALLKAEIAILALCVYLLGLCLFGFIEFEIARLGIALQGEAYLFVAGLTFICMMGIIILFSVIKPYIMKKMNGDPENNIVYKSQEQIDYEEAKKLYDKIKETDEKNAEQGIQTRTFMTLYNQTQGGV